MNMKYLSCRANGSNYIQNLITAIRFDGQGNYLSGDLPVTTDLFNNKANIYVSVYNPAPDAQSDYVTINININGGTFRADNTIFTYWFD